MGLRRICLLLAGVSVVALTPAADAQTLSPQQPSTLLGFTVKSAAKERALEQAFDAKISPTELDGWLKQLASAPNHVGSPHDKANAEFQLALFKSWGWDAKIESYEVLYPTPISESLELLGPTRFKASLHEPEVAGDATSGLPGQLPPYVAYQGDGDVEAPLVYINQGMPDDYAALARMGVDVRGKIVIARYGGGWRGLKPKLAQEHGAIGCIIYSDPADDGYATDDVYPKGAQRPPLGVQRGSVADITTYSGDPLTPGVGATKDAKRLTRATAPTILKIPTLPISYADAQPFLAALDGAVVPRTWRGALPITYHVGPGPARVRLSVKSDWSLKTIYDVIATMKGSELPDEWVVRGNHHDGWVFGASDPLSGQVALMAEAKAIGALAKAGFKPKRTLIYASWDAEEPGLIGSTEWAEQHADELQKHAVVYINSDNIDRGFLHAGGSSAFTHMLGEVARDVTDPQTGVSLRERLGARLAVNALEGGGDRDKRLAKLATAGADLPLEPLGSGSDYTGFLQHLGVASLDIGFGGEGESGGVYHSAYDSYDHYRRFGDPGEAYGAALAKTIGRVVLRISQAGAPPLRFTDTAEAFAGYVDELKKIATARRERVEALDALVDKGAFKTAADPLKTSAAPPREATLAAVDFSALDAAVAKLRSSARAYDAAFALHGSLDGAPRAAVNALMIGMEQRLLEPNGLPNRPWYKNLAYAPGVLTGYGSKTFPGVREALEGDRTGEAAEYVKLTANAVKRYAEGLDEAASLMAGS